MTLLCSSGPLAALPRLHGLRAHSRRKTADGLDQRTAFSFQEGKRPSNPQQIVILDDLVTTGRTIAGLAALFGKTYPAAKVQAVCLSYASQIAENFDFSENFVSLGR
jgi:predicted amidophosphoribosyltransferase